jgi:hypothetical protein
MAPTTPKSSASLEVIKMVALARARAEKREEAKAKALQDVNRPPPDKRGYDAFAEARERYYWAQEAVEAVERQLAADLRASEIKYQKQMKWIRLKARIKEQLSDPEYLRWKRRQGR